MYAAEAGRLDIVKTLITKGADVNAIDAMGRSALSFAAANGNKAVVELLLKNNATINATGKAPALGTALGVAAAENREDIVNALLAHGGMPTQDDLTRAAWGGNLNIIQSFLDHGTVADSAALAEAAWGGHKEAAELLLANGSIADGNSLAFAARAGQLEIAELLLKNHAPVNVLTKAPYDSTPLLEAAGTGNKTMIKLLLDNGADINLPDSAGNTALMAAADSGKEGIIQFLLENGADPAQQNKAGVTALDTVRRYITYWPDSALLKDAAAALEKWSKSPVIKRAHASPQKRAAQLKL